MSEAVKEVAETFVDIKQSYVDEKLREFFETEHVEVNFENICLFSAKIVEEYNAKSEKKLRGKQKYEAAVELAKSVIEKSLAFVPEEARRTVVRNIYHNVEHVGQTIQFIIDLSNNPNIVNMGKWVENAKRKTMALFGDEEEGEETSNKRGEGCMSRWFACFRSKPNEEPSEEPKEEPSEEASEEVGEQNPEDVVVEEKPAQPSKKEVKRQKKAEKLRKKLELLSMTPEEIAQRKAEEREARNREIEELAKKIEEEREEKERKKAEAKEEERKKKAEAKAEKLRKKLELLSMTPEEIAQRKAEEKEAKKSKKESVHVESEKDFETNSEVGTANDEQKEN